MTTVNIPLVTLQVGSHDFGPASLADSDTRAILTISRIVAGGFNAKPATTQAAISIWQSGDGGATWDLLVSADIIGGSYINRHTGLPYTASSVSIPFQPGTGRQVKANVTVSGASVAVQGSLVIS